MWGVWMLAVAYWAASLDAKDHIEIPWHVMQSMRSARSKGELHGRVRIHRNLTRPAERVLQVHNFGLRMQKPGGMLQSPSIGTIAPPAHPRVHNMSTVLPIPEHEVIDNPVQFDDTCHLLNICVPIPYEKKPGHFHFPQCIQLQQCLGSCCDGAQSCHAQGSKPVKVLVEEYQFAGLHADGTPEFHTVNQSYATMLRHTECGCRRCRRSLDGPACPDRQELHDCTCRCRNHHEKAQCNGGNRWDEESCACVCELSACAPGLFLQPDECRCVEPPPTPPPGRRSHHRWGLVDWV